MSVLKSLLGYRLHVGNQTLPRLVGDAEAFLPVLCAIILVDEVGRLRILHAIPYSGSIEILVLRPHDVCADNHMVFNGSLSIAS